MLKHCDATVTLFKPFGHINFQSDSHAYPAIAMSEQGKSGPGSGKGTSVPRGSTPPLPPPPPPSAPGMPYILRPRPSVRPPRTPPRRRDRAPSPHTPPIRAPHTPPDRAVQLPCPPPDNPAVRLPRTPPDNPAIPAPGTPPSQGRTGGLTKTISATALLHVDDSIASMRITFRAS